MGRLLVELHVRDLGVIDDVTVGFGPGMTALTGETGAGKTLLVGALSRVLGGRADPAGVRAGAEEALVEGRFCDFDGVDEILLARAVPAQGRSRAWVDGRMATIGTLAEAAGALIELHGQHEHQALVRPDAQRRALDAFGQVDLTGYAAARLQLRRLVDESEALGGDARERARQVDLLRYQIGEIDGAGIEDAGEDGRLEAEEDRLSEAAAHRQAAAAALAAVRTGDDRGPARSTGWPRPPAALAGPPPLAGLEARVRSAMAELSDLASELRSVVETWEDDPARLDEIRADDASCSTSSVGSTGTPSTTCWPSPTTPGSAWPRWRGRGATGRRPRRRDHPGPGRCGRRGSGGGPGPTGDRCPCAGRADRVHPAPPGHALGPVHHRGGR